MGRSSLAATPQKRDAVPNPAQSRPSVLEPARELGSVAEALPDSPPIQVQR